MGTSKADTSVLTQQAINHQNLANFYRQAHDLLSAQGQRIVNAFTNAERPDDAATYQKWIANLQRLLDEASAHDDWANYFTQLVTNIESAEGLLTDDGTSPVRGHVRAF